MNQTFTAVSRVPRVQCLLCTKSVPIDCEFLHAAAVNPYAADDSCHATVFNAADYVVTLLCTSPASPASQLLPFASHAAADTTHAAKIIFRATITAIADFAQPLHNLPLLLCPLPMPPHAPSWFTFDAC